ncbi:transcriptional regulator [Kitasatospora sp. NPDC059747]|uniref:transcriptional regulator n=1 Tax=Kitasatospora sp. NPDC059747 TaxID=3346930 RepID=UPI003662256B
MHTLPGETPACPDTGRRRRLALQLAHMIPGAVAVAVSFKDPATQWPRAYARATDAAGRPLRLSLVVRRVAAQWIVRAHPNADWSRPHTLDLTTGQLAVAACPAVRGR